MIGRGVWTVACMSLSRAGGQNAIRGFYGLPAHGHTTNAPAPCHHAAIRGQNGVLRMYPVMLLRSSTDFHVSVSHDVPSETAREVGMEVRRVLHHIPGVWRVTVEQSPDRGRWRVELRGPTGRHTWTFLGACTTLPAVIGEKLGTFIRAASVQYQTGTRATTNRMATVRGADLQVRRFEQA